MKVSNKTEHTIYCTHC